MSLIGKEIADFSVQAYQNNEFRTVTKDDVLGKWSLFFFYPADFTFVCPTELEGLPASPLQSISPARVTACWLSRRTILEARSPLPTRW